MTKKSIFAGEYIIEIADNGHVDVVRVFRNAKAIMEEIAVKNGMVVDSKWNTQDLGRHLIKQFGEGNSARFDDIVINKMPNASIEIYQECKNVKAELRLIAGKIGFGYDEKWNTQTFGSKLSNYLAEHKEDADKILQTPNRKKKENETVTDSIKVDLEKEYWHLSLGGCELNDGGLNLSNIAELYSNGEGEKVRKTVRDAIFAVNNKICSFYGWENTICRDNEEDDDEEDYYDEDYDLYFDNLVCEKDGRDYIAKQFQFPCNFIVVVGAKVVDTFTVDEEPEKLEGFFYRDIPFCGYEDASEVEERVEEDPDGVDEAMLSLIHGKNGVWTHTWEIGSEGDGLYVSDFKSNLFAVVVEGETVLAYED